jgi:hypothetical protein
MSANALPITLTRFSTALADLPIDAIYAKHTELRNNIAHMEASNTQLEEFARDNDDRDCYEALMENRVTIKRFEERIGALREEVVGRGLAWRPVEEEGDKEVNGAPAVVQERTNGVRQETTNGGAAVQQQSMNGTAPVQQQSTTNGAGEGEDDGVFL